MSSQSSSSSSSSTGHLRVWGWIAYSPCSIVELAPSSSSEWDEAGTIGLSVTGYEDDGFTVGATGISGPTYVRFAYMAI